MALIDELKEKRDYHAARVKGLSEDISAAIRLRASEQDALDDLDRAIAALSPSVSLLKEGEIATGFKSYNEAQEPQPDPADLPPPTDAEFEALEKLDAEPAEFISDLTGDPAVEPESGLHGEPAVEEYDGEGGQHGEPAPVVSEPQTQAEGTGDRVEQEKFEAHKHGGEAGFWASRLFGKPKVEA